MKYEMYAPAHAVVRARSARRVARWDDVNASMDSVAYARHPSTLATRDAVDAVDAVGQGCDRPRARRVAASPRSARRRIVGCGAAAASGGWMSTWMTTMMTWMMTWMTTDGCARAGGDGVGVVGVVGVVRRTAVAPRRDAREGVAVVGRPRWCVITRRTYARVDRTCARVRHYATHLRAR